MVSVPKCPIHEARYAFCDNSSLRAVTKSCRHVEYISDDMDDDLGICSEDLNDDMDTGVIS